MTTRFRKVVALLLLLALPLQGFAAAGMSACLPGHARLMAPVSPDEMPAETAPASGHDHGSHHHVNDGAHDSDVAGPDAEAVAQIAGTVVGTQDSPVRTKCSACATCCIGAALLPQSILPTTPGFSLAPPLAVSTAPVSFITDGPIRPPRSVLA